MQTEQKSRKEKLHLRLPKEGSASIYRAAKWENYTKVIVIGED